MKKRTLTTIAILTAAASAPMAAYAEYRRNFYTRMSESTGFIDSYYGEHPELKHEDFSCSSSKGLLIRGQILRPDGESKALIVMTHGYNMSCENYMPLADRFAGAGFTVLMFDGLGIGMSEGDRIYGLPQHILDMDSVLKAVQADPGLSALPLLLFGHSWGGYAACCISAYAEYPIAGILTCGAFRKSSSSMIPTIKKRYPAIAPFLISSVEILERFLFGSTAGLTSSEGLRTAACPARLYHSTDDVVVGYEESFLTMKEELADLENIEFITLEGRNHDLYLPPENDRRQRTIIKELTLIQDPDLRKELTRMLWDLMSETDEDLAREFISFFNSCV